MKLLKVRYALLSMTLVPVATAEEKATCHESSRYLIVEGSTGEVGTNFLVKYKRQKGEPPVCKYVVKPGDFEIPNEEAEYFLGLQGNLLILDSGTGPDHRGLIIWDLSKKKKVYTGTYSSESEKEVKIKPGYMEFWLETGRARDENCPKAKEWRANGLGAAIETWVRLDLSDFTVTKSSKTRCSPRQ
jgi:hypothetical protein